MTGEQRAWYLLCDETCPQCKGRGRLTADGKALSRPGPSARNAATVCGCVLHRIWDSAIERYHTLRLAAPGELAYRSEGYRTSMDTGSPLPVTTDFSLKREDALIDFEWLLKRGLNASEWSLVRLRWLESADEVAQSKASGVPLNLLQAAAERLQDILSRRLLAKFVMPEPAKEEEEQKAA